MTEQKNIKPPEERKKHLKWYRRFDTIARIEMWLLTNDLKLRSIYDYKNFKLNMIGPKLIQLAMKYYINKGLLVLPVINQEEIVNKIQNDIVKNFPGVVEIIATKDNEYWLTIFINNPETYRLLENQEFVHFEFKGVENDKSKLH